MRQEQNASRRWDRRHARETLARFAEVRGRDRKDADYQRLRSEVVTAHLSFVRYLVLKFANRGEPLDDLLQVGALALIKAVDRFELARGVEFSKYAGPTIVGEIKRHFRDKAWAVRVPRRLQDLTLALNRAIEEVSAQTGRIPAPGDLARHLHTSEEEVVQALQARHAYRLISLDRPFAEEDGRNHTTLDQYIGAADHQLARSENVATLKPAFSVLNHRERAVLYWHFYERVPQREIATRLNVSQMYVSRIQRAALEKMRQVLAE